MINPTRVFIDKDLNLTPEIEYLISRVKPTPEKVGDSRPVYDLINQADDPVGFAKKSALHHQQQGRFDPPVPGHQLLHLL
jgi:spore photoproduct lyase